MGCSRLNKDNPTLSQLTLIRTTLAASTATSVPVPIAIPMSAWARAGESFTPSPTMATLCPRCCNCFTLATLCEGKTSAKTVCTPIYRVNKVWVKKCLKNKTSILYNHENIII